MKDYEELSRKHFNNQARDYDEKDTVYYSREGKISCRDIREQLRGKEYDSLLDVGCGTGFLFELLTEDRPARYCGLDLAEEMIKAAEEKTIPGAVFVVGKCDALPYEDGTFDVITCSQSFHHYPDGAAAMAEAYRVLAPGGIYILSDTGVGGLGGWIDNHILFRLSRSGDCHTQNRKTIAAMMEKAGFTVTDSRQISRFIYTVTGRKGE